MAYLLGTQRGLDACASPSGAFVVLALDHRQNLRRELRPSEPDSVSHAEMMAFKAEVVRALAPTATGTLPPTERDAWLRSEGVARLRRLAEHVTQMAMPWRPRWERARRPDPPSEGWYARY